MLLLLQVAYNIILPVLLVIGLGVVIERRLSLDLRPLSGVTFYLFIPALVVNGLAQSDLKGEEIGLILFLEIILSLLLALIGWGVAKLFGFDRKLESAFMLTVAFINAGNYGLALTEFAFGMAGLQRAIIFFIGTAITGNTVGIFLASRGTASIGRSLLNMLLVPLPYATLLGLVINFGQIALPTPLDRALTLLSQAAVPAMLVTLGMQLSRTSLTGRLQPIVLATATRLVIGPLVALPLMALMGFSGLTWQVTLVMAGMPTAVTSTILATEFGSDAELTSAIVLTTTVVSVATLSILLTLLL